MPCCSKTWRPKRHLSRLFAGLPKTFAMLGIRIARPDDEKESVVCGVREAISAWPDVQEAITTDGIQAHLNNGWFLVRASNA